MSPFSCMYKGNHIDSGNNRKPHRKLCEILCFYVLCGSNRFTIKILIDWTVKCLNRYIFAKLHDKYLPGRFDNISASLNAQL